jgi:hypothetical protein
MLDRILGPHGVSSVHCKHTFQSFRVPARSCSEDGAIGEESTDSMPLPPAKT